MCVCLYSGCLSCGSDGGHILKLLPILFFLITIAVDASASTTIVDMYPLCNSFTIYVSLSIDNMSRGM